MAFAIPLGMQDAESLRSRRGRRVLIALLILLLILLPLYLWPLRGGLSGLPGASALSGAVRDPRSAASVAQIPDDVWDALMGQIPAPPAVPPSAKPPLNLTMINSANGIPGSGIDQGAGDTLLSDNPAAFVRGLLAQVASPDLPGDDTVSIPTELVSTPGSGTGSGVSPGGFGSGGYPGLGNLGPSGAGGPSGALLPVAGLGPTLDPNVPDGLAPTPEPATFLLVGSNLALLGAAAWRRCRRQLGIPPTG